MSEKRTLAAEGSVEAHEKFTAHEAETGVVVPTVWLWTTEISAKVSTNQRKNIHASLDANRITIAIANTRNAVIQNTIFVSLRKNITILLLWMKKNAVMFVTLREEECCNFFSLREQEHYNVVTSREKEHYNLVTPRGKEGCSFVTAREREKNTIIFVTLNSKKILPRTG